MYREKRWVWALGAAVVCAALGAACGPGKPGGAAGPEGRDGVRGGDGVFAPVAPPRPGRAPGPAPAPSGCRPVSFRAIPAAPIPPVGTVQGEDTRALPAARGFVVVRSGVGPARAVAWDADTNRWLDAGPGPETYRRGDTGPMSGGRFMPVGPDHVLLLWRNDSQRPGLQAALADVAAGSFEPISLAGGPDHVGVEGFDAHGRLVVFDRRSLGGGWRFAPRARVWAAVTADGRPAATGAPTVLALGDRVLAFGAGASGAGAVGALYDPETDAWTAIAAGPTPDAAFVTATDDAVFWWSQDAPFHGAVYERSTDRWRDVTSAGAPLARPASGLRLFAFTGSHVVQAEQHPDDHGLPHDPAAVYALDAGSWRRIPIPPTYGDPFALPDGRVVLFGRGSPQPIVIDPRSGLVCTP
ncbi:MAG: hypothetical protein IT373_06885, partial [Polyangiaceae bacterium]|nr:hypothetical protein [Polyangiaceae bacterium]